jgi:hypothetical protein
MGIPTLIRFEQPGDWNVTGRHFPPFPRLVSWNLLCQDCYMLTIPRPAAMMWPGQFANTSLFYALHDWSPSDESETHGWSISRYRYFLYVTIGAFIWYW